MNENNRHKEVNDILNNLFKESSLVELFERRLHELGIKKTNALKLLKMEVRPLNGIIKGTQRRNDYKNFEKVAAFLNISTEDLIQKHTALLEKNFEDKNSQPNKKKFIREHFDLAAWKKAGFISDVTDIEEVEDKINNYYGFDSIYEYEKRSFNAMFSKPVLGHLSQQGLGKVSLARDNWLTAGRQLATRLDNPYQFDRQGLIKYFPQIRWYSTNVEFGLINVIKALYKFGITVIYQSPLSSLHLRGATIPVTGKPCILLTDHKGFYPTLWHGLIHELYHVLFDWDDIKTKDKPHISEDSNEVYVINENEVEADEFARQYLFSKTKLHEVQPYMRDEEHVEKVAKDNDVDTSFIYVYHAFDNGSVDRMAWPRARRKTPNIKRAVSRLENPYNNPLSIEEFAKKIKLEIYN